MIPRTNNNLINDYLDFKETPFSFKHVIIFIISLAASIFSTVMVIMCLNNNTSSIITSLFILCFLIFGSLFVFNITCITKYYREVKDYCAGTVDEELVREKYIRIGEKEPNLSSFKVKYLSEVTEKAIKEHLMDCKNKTAVANKILKNGVSASYHVVTDFGDYTVEDFVFNTCQVNKNAFVVYTNKRLDLLGCLVYGEMALVSCVGK